ncbi:hypothetical protein [Actinobacillus porcinus]|uniref:hypothetical protein n=1 Tax=Actinobacillus porcinus TaxID=51048 RepID=UPI001083E096|nr:hypothetical protein [Actinobacillus porcinus]
MPSMLTPRLCRQKRSHTSIFHSQKRRRFVRRPCEPDNKLGTTTQLILNLKLSLENVASSSIKQHQAASSSIKQHQAASIQPFLVNFGYFTTIFVRIVYKNCKVM